MRRLAVLVKSGHGSFIEPLIDRIRSDSPWLVRTFTGYARAPADAYAWGDVIWCEWADDLTEAAVKAQPAFRKPVVVRLHSYEAFMPWPSSIRWENVARCVFVAEHVRTMVRESVANFDMRTTSMVIPNGVDLERFALQEHKPGHRLGVVANVNGKKAPEMWLQVLAKLPGGYHIHVAGKMQDGRYRHYLPHMAERLGVADRLHIEGFVADIVDWWRDKDYVLSTSPHEGCPMNVLEAMALGVKPVVHDFIGCKDLFGFDGWRTPVEAATRVTPGYYNPELYRARVEERFSLARQVETVLGMLEEL